MFDDIIKEKFKRLTADDITWDKDCSNCNYSRPSSELVGLVYCEKHQSNKYKGFFCYDWRAIEIKIIK
jgi:hypothetical protein